jgi:alpha,alpha-trehalose phosphorylase
VYGFGGCRIAEDGVRLFPLLPEGWDTLSFPLKVQGSRIRVSADRAGCTLALLEGDPVELTVFDTRVWVTKASARVKRAVRGVIFDLDGVVTNTARYHFQAWSRIAVELGIPFDEEKNERFKGVSRAACMDLLLELGGRSMTQEEKQTWAPEKRVLFTGMEALSPDDYPAGHRLLPERAAQRGVPVALFSVSRNTDRILEKFG